MKVLLVGSQHGNELLGEKLYEYLEPGKVDFVIANPRAREAEVRFTETDMNRSFVASPHSYEERRASALLDYINTQAYDLVLDLHTTTCEQPPCLIVAEVESSMHFIRSSSISNIVCMPPDFTGRSLIGNVPQAVSIEVNEAQISDVLLSSLAADIEKYIGHKATMRTRQVYFVDDFIMKGELSQEEANTLINFKYTDKGFYPILYGEASYAKYTHYLGFKARKMQRIKV